ncbi:hypothetical protein QMA69_05350 [Burkholderia pseudomallei]|nr:hypothetical protein [Burkholderia pseudomallei]
MANVCAFRNALVDYQAVNRLKLRVVSQHVVADSEPTPVLCERNPGLTKKRYRPFRSPVNPANQHDAPH